MPGPWTDSELVGHFLASATDSESRAPLNAALARIIATDRSLYGLLGHAPPEQQLPVLLLAAIHDTLLRTPDHPLAAWYPNLRSSPRNPAEAGLARTLRDFIADHEATIIDLVSTRRVQTNEVGRCALLLAGFVRAAQDTGALAHIDVGASAGLNVLLPHFRYRYDDGPLIGADTAHAAADSDPDSDSDSDSVVIECSTRGEVPPPDHVPDISASCGIDQRPIDVTDPDEARWLEACCWPDQADRFERLRRAISIARRHPPELLAGDAVDSIEPAVERMSSRGHPTVTTTWVLNYLGDSARAEFVAALDRAGASNDLSWVAAESPAMTPELPHPAELNGRHTTALTLVRWRSGRRVVDHLAECHPHGYWMHWLD